MTSDGPTVSADAGDPDLVAFQAATREEALRVARDHGWPRDEVNSTLDLLDLPPVHPAAGAEVTVEITADEGSRASLVAFATEDSARATVDRALTQLRRDGQLPGEWTIGGVRTVTRTIITIDSAVDGTVLARTTSSSTRPRVTVTGPAVLDGVLVDDPDALSDADRARIASYLETTLLYAFDHVYGSDVPPLSSTLLDITGARPAA